MSGAMAPRFCFSLRARAAERAVTGDVGKIAATIVVYGFDDAVAALQAAAWLGHAVRLKSPYTVSASLGPEVAWSMFRQASAAVPDAEATWVLDCGDDPGTAMAALRAGVPEIQVSLSGEALARLADIAEQRGARIAEDAEDSAILDLADTEDSVSACRQWLHSVKNALDCGRMPRCQR